MIIFEKFGPKVTRNCAKFDPTLCEGTRNLGRRYEKLREMWPSCEITKNFGMKMRKLARNCAKLREMLARNYEKSRKNLTGMTNNLFAGETEKKMRKVMRNCEKIGPELTRNYAKLAVQNLPAPAFCRVWDREFLLACLLGSGTNFYQLGPDFA